MVAEKDLDRMLPLLLIQPDCFFQQEAMASLHSVQRIFSRFFFKFTIYLNHCFFFNVTISVYKKNERKDGKNYRPITVLSIVNKFFEQKLSDHLTKYIDPHLSTNM